MTSCLGIYYLHNPYIVRHKLKPDESRWKHAARFSIRFFEKRCVAWCARGASDRFARNVIDRRNAITFGILHRSLSDYYVLLDGNV